MMALQYARATSPGWPLLEVLKPCPRTEGPRPPGRRPPGPPGGGCGAGAALALAVLAVLGVSGSWVLDRTQVLSTELVDVRSPAMSTSFRLESALLNQETGIRGYGLTGNPVFLTPYQQGLADQRTHTARLAELLRGNATGLADLTALQDAVARWQQETADPVAALPPGAPTPGQPSRPPPARPPSTPSGTDCAASRST
ncbi:hypothetical protein GCM10020229_83290 [Kitasatospora albolonga]